MFSEDNLKQKTNQDLRKICKELNCAQYGDKATLIKRILETIATCDDQVEVANMPMEEAEEHDYNKMKKSQLIELLKKRKIGGFSNKPKADLIRKLVKHDEEQAKLAREDAALNHNFGECEQCVDLPNIKIITKALFNCYDCDLKICGPCEVAHIKTKATRHHKIESLLQLDLVQRVIPDFAKPSCGGTQWAATAVPEDPPSWVDRFSRSDDELLLLESSTSAGKKLGS